MLMEKGKKKIPEYDIDIDESDQNESDSGKNEEGALETKSETTEGALKSTNKKLHRSTRQKDPVKKYGYNEYMAHHYAYMTKVTEVREPKSYAEMTKDTN